LAIYLARESGIDVVLVSGKKSDAVSRRAAELKIECYQKITDKTSFVAGYCKKTQSDPKRCCFVGDDLVDLGAMMSVGLRMAPRDAAREVKSAAHIVLRSPGGRGAVREALELLLKAKGAWGDAINHYKEH
jgi:YrbI family 3-deoxy-D-manno-octulosonate 8-phosphate phosphatase